MVSPNLLTTRLRETVEAGIMEKDAEGAYGLTPRGKSLVDLLAPMHRWAEEWAEELRAPRPSPKGPRRRR
jgi:DNA-binding HxlR family transcriptional regulator